MLLQRCVLEAHARPAGDVTRPVQLDQGPQHRPQHDQAVSDAREEPKLVAAFGAQRPNRRAFGPVDFVQERHHRRADDLEQRNRVADEGGFHLVEHLEVDVGHSQIGVVD